MIADGQGARGRSACATAACQRRHQKVIEESASPALTRRAGARGRWTRRARLALRAGYRSAGTVEFLYEPASALLVHGGQRAPAGRAPGHRGRHRPRPRQAAAPRRRRRAPRGRAARAVRATRSRRASTPRTRRSASRPRPGRIALLRLPTGPGVRVDTGVAEGDVDPARVRLDDRQGHRLGPRPRRGAGAAAPRARRDDGRRRRRHDQPGLPARAARPPGGARRRGRHDLAGPLQLRGEIVPARHADVALLQAAIELAEAETAADRARFYAFARRGRPQAAAGLARTIELRHRGQALPLRGRADRPAPLPRHRRRRASRSSVERLGAHERRLRSAAASTARWSPSGRRPARRGRRRPAPDLARRRRPRAQPRAGRRRLDPRRARRRGRSRATSSPWSRA